MGAKLFARTTRRFLFTGVLPAWGIDSWISPVDSCWTPTTLASVELRWLTSVSDVLPPRHSLRAHDRPRLGWFERVRQATDAPTPWLARQ